MDLLWQTLFTPTAPYTQQIFVIMELPPGHKNFYQSYKYTYMYICVVQPSSFLRKYVVISTIVFIRFNILK